MLSDAADQIVGHADVQRTADAAGEDVDVEATWLHLTLWNTRSPGLRRAMTAVQVRLRRPPSA